MVGCKFRSAGGAAYVHEVNVVVLGDSQAICDESLCSTGPRDAQNRWPVLLQTEASRNYGLHSTGVQPLIFRAGLHAVNSEVWRVNGPWAQSTLNGPSQVGLLPAGGTVRLEPGSSATYSAVLPYSGLNTYCAASLFEGRLTIQVDGRRIGTCSGFSLLPKPRVVVSRKLAYGHHSATFSCAWRRCYLYGAEATLGPTGVSIHDVAVGGATAEFFGTKPNKQLAWTDGIPGGTQLALIALLTNDPGVGYSPASYHNALTSIILHEKHLGAEVLLVLPPVSNVAAIRTFPSYTQALMEAAKETGTPVISIQRDWGTTVERRSGYWSDDLIHPTDKGTHREYDLIRAGLERSLERIASTQGLMPRVQQSVPAQFPHSAR